MAPQSAFLQNNLVNVGMRRFYKIFMNLYYKNILDLEYAGSGPKSMIFHIESQSGIVYSPCLKGNLIGLFSIEITIMVLKRSLSVAYN